MPKSDEDRQATYVHVDLMPRPPTSFSGLPPLPRPPTSCPGLPPHAQASHLMPRPPTSCPGLPLHAQASHLVLRPPPHVQTSHLTKGSCAQLEVPISVEAAWVRRSSGCMGTKVKWLECLAIQHNCPMSAALWMRCKSIACPSM